MKTINDYIQEKFLISKDIKINKYKYYPKTKEELKSLIEERIDNEGPKCDLNDIDVSNITDMHNMFFNSEFDGDISYWDVSNVNNMSAMFMKSNFNGDISKWNVSKVKNMTFMFSDSNFNGDISNWDVTNVDSMYKMFMNSQFEGDINKWNVSDTCAKSSFIFYNSKLEKQNKLPKWYKK